MILVVGPTGQGHSDVIGLPLHWSESENIVWKTPIHDLDYPTPVVWSDQIWLTTATMKGTILYAVCIDPDSGQIVHDLEVFGPEKPQWIHRNNSFATPSPVMEEVNALENFSGASLAVADESLLLCTRTHLQRIEDRIAKYPGRPLLFDADVVRVQGEPPRSSQWDHPLLC